MDLRRAIRRFICGIGDLVLAEQLPGKRLKRSVVIGRRSSRMLHRTVEVGGPAARDRLHARASAGDGSGDAGDRIGIPAEINGIHHCLLEGGGIADRPDGLGEACPQRVRRERVEATAAGSC